MERILRFFVDYKRSTITILLFMVILGLYAYNKIPKESNPDVKIPIIYVRVSQDGISPEDAQRMLLRPLENALRSISGIKEMTSYASEGGAAVIMEFMAGFNSKAALEDVRAKVNDAEHDLPADAKRPDIREVDLSLIPVLNIILSGNVPERSLYKVAMEMRDALEGIPDVLSANIRGDREEVLEVLLEPKVIERHKLFLPNVAKIMSNNNTLVTAGSIKNADGEFMLKLPGLIKGPESLKNFPIYTDGLKVLKLQDIAEVRRTYKDPQIIARVNGKPAVVLEISKRSGSNILKVVSDARAVVDEYKKKLPSNIEITYSQDESSDIYEMIAELENGILLAGLLVIVIVVLSIGVKAALLISLSLPVCFFSCILVLYLAGFSMNIIVLFSLILTVGMVVDDAIVISEYAERKLLEGHSASDSFVNAATRMFMPVVTATLVKIVVFLPLLFWPGVLGQFMKYMPITVTIIMTSSLLFALCFQPAIGSILMRNPHKIDQKALASIIAAETTGDLSKLDHVTRFYGTTLNKVLQHPKTFVLAIIGFIIGVYGFFIAFGTGSEFFPKVDPDGGIVIVRAPGNLSLQQKNHLLQEVETAIFDMKDEVKVFYTVAGNISGVVNDAPRDAIGRIQLEFVDWRYRRKADAIMNDIKTKVSQIKGVQTQVIVPRPGPNASKPIGINISADDYDKISPFIESLVTAMSKITGIYDIEDTRPVPAIEWHLNVNRELAGKYGLSIGEISNALIMATDGLKVSTYRPDDTDEAVDVVLRLPQEYRSVFALPNIRIANSAGNIIPLSSFATLKVAQNVPELTRINKETIMSVRANVHDGFLVNDKVEEIRAWLVEHTPPGIIVHFKGDDENQQETAAFLPKAFCIALVTMFIIMLLQFNSFYYAAIIMSAVFLSTVGVLLGLIISWQPFGIVMCGIGIIALAGIVLNNNILFVDTYHRLKVAGHSPHEAALMAGIQRMRPILLTASTAVLGLLPMVIGVTINFMEREVLHGAPSSQWWRQLSASIAGGLTFATVLTLFFTPCLLVLGGKKEKNSKNIDNQLAT